MSEEFSTKFSSLTWWLVSCCSSGLSTEVLALTCWHSTKVLALFRQACAATCSPSLYLRLSWVRFFSASSITVNFWSMVSESFQTFHFVAGFVDLVARIFPPNLCHHWFDCCFIRYSNLKLKQKRISFTKFFQKKALSTKKKKLPLFAVNAWPNCKFVYGQMWHSKDFMLSLIVCSPQQSYEMELVFNCLHVDFSLFYIFKCSQQFIQSSFCMH